MTITAKVAAAAVLAMAVAFGDANGTWTKRAGVGTGGTDWTSWSEPQNWQDGTVAFEGCDRHGIGEKIITAIKLGTSNCPILLC